MSINGMMMKFLNILFLGAILLVSCKPQDASVTKIQKPIVISTWDSGVEVNDAAWKVLAQNGRAIDAVEAGARYIENTRNCCVGTQGNPDRDGHVTLDACIMDDRYNCGSVAFVESVKYPSSLARLVMDSTPHVFLVGEGAKLFARQMHQEMTNTELSPEAQKEYNKWLEKSTYKPVPNIENSESKSSMESVPGKLQNGEFNHDTMGVLALDDEGNLSGVCTTSGMAFKMHGRVGDSPIIGAGLYVDNEVGAATSSGVGEEVIRISGSHTVVEYMRHGFTPEEACKKTVERIVNINPEKAKSLQVGFIAINKKGEIGGFSILPKFTYSVSIDSTKAQVYTAKSWFN